MDVETLTTARIVLSEAEHAAHCEGARLVDRYLLLLGVHEPSVVATAALLYHRYRHWAAPAVVARHANVDVAGAAVYVALKFTDDYLTRASTDDHYVELPRLFKLVAERTAGDKTRAARQRLRQIEGEMLRLFLGWWLGLAFLSENAFACLPAERPEVRGYAYLRSGAVRLLHDMYALTPLCLFLEAQQLADVALVLYAHAWRPVAACEIMTHAEWPVTPAVVALAASELLAAKPPDERATSPLGAFLSTLT